MVAGTALGLLTPIAAQASEVINLDEMGSYRRRSPSKPKRFDQNTFATNSSDELLNPSGKVKGIEAGSFSDTTSLDGKVVMALGAIDGAETIDKSDKWNYSYVYQMNLNTSFTGDDNLYVRLKTGDGWKGTFYNKPGTYHIEGTGYTDTLSVDKLWYTLPLGGNVTATIGPKIENYYMLAASPSVYKPGVLKAFKLGGHASAFGASTSTGVGLAWRPDNGFATSITANSKKAHTSQGLFTEEDLNKINTQVAYTGDNYHLSATYSRQKGWNSWSYYSTKDLAAGVGQKNANADGVALRAWWRPDETGTATPSISVGYDTISITGATNGLTEGEGYFLGMMWADMIQPDDKIGFAIGQPMKATKAAAGTNWSEIDPLIWELYYSFRPNDSIEVSPGIFGGSDVYENEDEDLFGGILTTTFKF